MTKVRLRKSSLQVSYPSPPSSSDTESLDSDPSTPRSFQGIHLNPPQIISIKDLEPLQLAKKKHYVPVQSACKIQKKNNSAKPQGRPFNDTLNARFFFFKTIDDLIINVLHTKDLDTIRLIKQHPVISSTNKYALTKSLRQEIIDNSKNLVLKEADHCKFQTQSIEFENIEKDHTINVHDELCKTFNTNELSFVKIIRNTKGKLIKFEILSRVNNDEIDIKFIKKFITFPRYKSKMKIFLINGKFDKDVCFYNDLRMFIYDIENKQLVNKKSLVNNKVLLP